jgi:hypothetical protein
MLLKALFVVAFSHGTGNDSTGSRSVTVVSSMETCYAARDAFVRTLREPVFSTKTEKRWVLEDEIFGFNDNYVLACEALTPL